MKTPEEKAAYRKAWYAANREAVLAKQREWYAANKDKAAASRRQWYEKNREVHIARGKAWKQANPEKHKESSRRSMRRAAGMLNPTAERRNGQCPICLRDGIELHCDHDHSNGVIRGWLCRRCNPALGLLNDSVEAMQRAIDYLMANKDPSFTSGATGPGRSK